MSSTASSQESIQEFNTGWIIKHGIIGGVIVAIVFAVAEMIATALTGGSLWMPFQAFASVPLGTPPPKIPLSTAIPVGLIFHLIYTVGITVIFIFIWAKVSALGCVAKIIFKRESPMRSFRYAATPNSEATNFACPRASLPANLLT